MAKRRSSIHSVQGRTRGAALLAAPGGWAEGGDEAAPDSLLSPGERLGEVMRQEIGRHGPVSFKWFMQQALYHPELGYYASGRARIGRRGDFYTNVSVGKIYGELLAKQFEEMWLRLGSPVSFAIVEEGAHGGQLADDILNWIRNFSSRDFFESVRYWIIEPFAPLQAEQQARLSQWPRSKVRWCPALTHFETGALYGVHFSNELLDAFPVHLVTYAGGGWRENFVDVRKDRFTFVYGPPSSGDLRAHLAGLPVPPASHQPYRTEVNLAALRWVENVSKVLGRGYVLTVDYGYPRDQFYAPERREGTLTGYRNHARVDDPFEHLGEADLTAHVEFTSLAARAEEKGLQLCGYCDQHHFMVGLGENDLRQIEQATAAAGVAPNPELAHYLRTFQTLVHPGHLGMAFKFLGFQKNVPGGGAPGAGPSPLGGFRYGGDPRAALGLAPAPARGGLGGDPDDPYAPF